MIPRPKYLPTPFELTQRPVYAANRLRADDESVKLQAIRDTAYYRGSLRDAGGASTVPGGRPQGGDGRTMRLNPLIQGCPEDHDDAVAYYRERCRQLAFDMVRWQGTQEEFEDYVGQLYELYEFVFPFPREKIE